jgi:hypothetical protein
MSRHFSTSKPLTTVGFLSLFKTDFGGKDGLMGIPVLFVARPAGK